MVDLVKKLSEIKYWFWRCWKW